jgi:hypothetical protein
MPVNVATIIQYLSIATHPVHGGEWQFSARNKAMKEKEKEREREREREREIEDRAEIAGGDIPTCTKQQLVKAVMPRAALLL